MAATRGAYGRWAGFSEDSIKHPVKTDRATPLIDADCIRGVRERVDYKGAVLAPTVSRVDAPSTRSQVAFQSRCSDLVTA